MRMSMPSSSAAVADVEENLRVAALRSFDVLDTPREEAFDRIARLVKNFLDVPIAHVALMDADRLWMKACIGLDDLDYDRETTFCDLVIRNAAPVVIPDLTKDDRLKDSPFVTGEAHLRFYVGVPLKSAEGFIIGTVCAIDTKAREFTERELDVMLDLAAVAMNELELRRSAEVDVLTKVLSRRAFNAQASQALSLMARQNRPSSVIMVDIDHFKSINDTYGHATGDRVLSAVATICQSNVRSTDIMGRLGGEEFAILLPGSDHVNATRSAEKIRLAIRQSPVAAGNVSIKVTASFGVASIGDGGFDLDAVVAQADEGLYQAKRNGRDRVVCIQADQDTGRRKKRA